MREKLETERERKTRTASNWPWALVVTCLPFLAIVRAQGLRFLELFPLPASVRTRLEAKQSLAGMENICHSTNGRIFCVRCLIWRPPDGTAGDVHHCSICQRCVVQHDHHCGVYGVCIAGRSSNLCHGTMRFYAGIWVCLAVGLFSSLAAAASARLQ